MAYLWGALLAIGTGALATLTGMDRSRAFYPTVLIVVASYYGLFAVMASATAALWPEINAFALFTLAAIVGFRSNLWIVVAGLVGHGIFDLLHPHVIANEGVPAWWPAFCLAYDGALGLYMAVRLWRDPHMGGTRT